MDNQNNRRFEVRVNHTTCTMDIIMTGMPIGNLTELAEQIADTASGVIAGAMAVQFGNAEFGRYLAHLAKRKALSGREISYDCLEWFLGLPPIDPTPEPDPDAPAAAPGQ